MVHKGAHPDRHESDQRMQDRDGKGSMLFIEMITLGQPRKGWRVGSGSRDLPAPQQTNNPPINKIK